MTLNSTHSLRLDARKPTSEINEIADFVIPFFIYLDRSMSEISRLLTPSSLITVNLSSMSVQTVGHAKILLIHLYQPANGEQRKKFCFKKKIKIRRSPDGNDSSSRSQFPHRFYPYRWTRALKYVTDDLIVLGWGRGKYRSRRGPMIKRILRQGRGGMSKTRERMDDKCEGQHYKHLFVPIIQNKFVRREDTWLQFR